VPTRFPEFDAPLRAANIRDLYVVRSGHNWRRSHGDREWGFSCTPLGPVTIPDIRRAKKMRAEFREA